MNYDLQTEQACLGALLDGAPHANALAILEAVPAPFYNSGHAAIYECILTLIEGGNPLDPLLVAKLITERKQEGIIGGVAYIYDIIESVPSPGNIEEYAIAVRDAAIRRRLADLSKNITQWVKDPEIPTGEAIQRTNTQLATLATIPNAKRTWKTTSIAVPNVLRSIEERYQSDTLLGVSTGFKDIDLITGGFQRGDMIVLAARPSMGKSMLAHLIAYNVACAEQSSALIISLEMDSSSIINRLVSRVSQVPYSRIRDGKMLTSTDWTKITRAASEIAQSNLIIDDTPGLRINQVPSVCTQVAEAHPDLSLIVIDYLQLLRANSTHADIYSRVTEASQTVKETARMLDIPVMALSQLSRAIEKRPDPRPILSDLRESGAIEQDSDLVAFLHRDDYYDENLPRQNTIEFIIKKHRNGPIGTLKLSYEPRIMSISGTILRQAQ